MNEIINDTIPETKTDTKSAATTTVTSEIQTQIPKITSSLLDKEVLANLVTLSQRE